LNLNCGFNSIHTLPSLPDSLKNIICNDNVLTELPKLPDSLLHLDCNHNVIEELPSLPNDIEIINCNSNLLSTIPELPGSLLELECNDNDIEELPELPDSLLYLDCKHNNIEELPTLPNGIEKVDCGFNHIRDLLDFPESLEDFNCIRNPLTFESFIRFTEEFPVDMEPDDYPEGFVERLDELTEHELTEGDEIEARNMAIAYEVHKAFDKIDLSKLYPVIGSESPDYNPELLFGIIQDLVHNNTLEEEEHARIITLFERFTENIRDIFRCDSDTETKRLLSTVLTYVSQQNPEFKNNYIRFFIDDISSAYEFNTEIPDLDTVSCAKGIKERIILSLKSATLGQTEAYQPLLNAFTNKIPIDIMRQFTSDCLKEVRVQELFEAKPDITTDEKVKILASCIREKLQGTEYFPLGGAEEIPDPPELTEYIATLKYGFEGGRKTKRKIKKIKKTRKIKKTKRKIKKSKLSKRIK
jgi:hypothetical protein